jgi:hypothetical protein
VAKSKRARTLLEVIGKHGQAASEGFPAPDWWTSTTPQRAEQEKLPDESATSPASPPGRRRTLQLGRLRIPLTPTNMVVTLGCLAIVTFIALQISSLPGGEQTEAELLAGGDDQSIDQLRDQPPRSDALDVILGRAGASEQAAVAASADLPAQATGPGEAAQPPSPGTAARQPGLNYVIVETFRGPDASVEALRARKFLTEKGIRASVERIGAHLCLVTERGFAARDPQMDAYCRRIENLGQQYFASGGKYRFKGCYGKLYRSNGW